MQQQQQQQPATPSSTYVATSPPPPPPAPKQTPLQGDYQHQHQQYQKPTAGRNRRPNWLLAAAACLLGVIIGGAIVAGVLGSMLANRSSSSSNGGATPATECKTADPARGTPATGAGNGTSSSSSSSSSAPPATGTPAPAAMLTNYEAANWRNVSSLASPCPRIEGATVEAMDGTRYRVECRIDTNGRGKEAPFDMKDIQSVVAYSFEDCVRSCASFNKLSVNVQGASPAMVCRTVVWRSRMDERQFFDTGGNCFLKNATRADDVKGIPCDMCITGTLL